MIEPKEHGAIPRPYQGPGRARVGKAGRRACVVAVRGTNFCDAVACIMSAQTSLNHKEVA